MRKITTTEYVLNEQEARQVRIALDYAFHRLKKHINTGIHELLRVEEVDKLRRQITRNR